MIKDQSQSTYIRSDLGDADPKWEHIYCNVLLHVLDKPGVDYTVVQGPNGSNWSTRLKAVPNNINICCVLVSEHK